MSKGTPSKGKHNKRSHIKCRRCGGRSFHMRKKICAGCGYGNSAKMRSFAWQTFGR